MNIRDGIKNVIDEVIEIRRKIHEYPERGFDVENTASYIEEKLKAYGYTHIDRIAKTGVVCVIKGSEGKKTIALRADMDGLPLQEENEVDYKSKRDGFMHACGHDGHVAMLLGYAKYLSNENISLKNNIVLLFQPAEEGPGGAEVLLDDGLLEKYKIDQILGLHLFPEFEDGQVASRVGPMMARNGEVTITVKGKASHGAIPQEGIDSIVAAAQIITMLQTIISRSINPMDSAIITFGKIEGGTAVNIISEETKISGTIRAFSDAVYEKIVSRIEEIAKGIGIAKQCEVHVEFNHMYKVVENDEMLVETLKEVSQDSFVSAPMFMISEDFSFYQQEIPGIFVFVGTHNEAEGYTNPLHNSRFNFREGVLLNGIQIYADMMDAL